MKKTGVIIGSIIGIVLIIAGIVAGIFYGFALPDKNNISEIKVANANYLAKDEITALNVNVNAGTVKIISDDVETVSVAYFSDERIKVDITEKSGVLTVKQTTKKHVALTYGGEVTVTIPAAQSGYALNADINYGDLTLNGLHTGNMTVDADMGTVSLQNITATKLEIDANMGSVFVEDTVSTNLEIDADMGSISLKNVVTVKLDAAANMGSVKGKKIRADKATFAADMGSIDVQLVGAESEYTMTGKVSMGSCNFTNRTGTTDKYVKATTNMGDILVSFITE